MITLQSLTKNFGAHRVLDALDLVARPGEVTLLVGANGCGKTTTMRLIAGLSAPDDGRIEIGGHSLATARAAAQAQLSFPATVAAVPRAAQRRRDSAVLCQAPRICPHHAP